MIIVKYGDSNRLEQNIRYKHTCSNCGCKVILDKSDCETKEFHDYSHNCGLELKYTCPFCDKEETFVEYDESAFTRWRREHSIKDFLECYVFWEPWFVSACVIIIGVGLTAALAFLLPLLYNNSYKYRIEEADRPGVFYADWTNSIIYDGDKIIYTHGDGNKIVSKDDVIVYNLKEDESDDTNQQEDPGA